MAPPSSLHLYTDLTPIRRAVAAAPLARYNDDWIRQRRVMAIQALAYVGVRTKALDDWASYGSRLLGLQRIDKSRSTLAFRMDDRKQRIVVDADGGEGIGFFGWEVADAAALNAVAARIEAAGTKVARGSRALADERHVEDLIMLN